MFDHLPEARPEDFGWFDRFLLFFLPTNIDQDAHGWQYVHFKVFKGHKVITFIERYH